MPHLRCSQCKTLTEITPKVLREHHERLPFLCSRDCLRDSIRSRGPFRWDKRFPEGALTGDKRCVSDEISCLSYLTGHGFRSTYERDIADWFYVTGEPYFYEPCTFSIAPDAHYTPDFYLPRRNLYLEVKGSWGLGQKNKVGRLLDQYKIDLILIPWSMRDAFGGFSEALD